jgi:hypothetical protein
MAYFRGFNRAGWKTRPASFAIAKAARSKYAASPAGKHRRLALNCFALAKRARAKGNTKHYWAMVKLGRQALALSKVEYRMWKTGVALRRRSFATQRAALAL